MIGVDEAGKGPVLGSMFIVGVKADTLPDGIKDSKKLSDKQREEIFSEFQGDFTVIEISPETIDSNNINEININAHSEVISELYEEGQEVICDASLSNTDKYKKKLDLDITDIICENNADETYDIVGMASIIAKEKREQHIKEIQEEIG
jgi:ribonuclease HII